MGAANGYVMTQRALGAALPRGLGPQSGPFWPQWSFNHRARWWVENRREWLRGGGADAPPARVATRAAWDQKWSGLMKRAPHTAAGHEVAEGGAMSEQWSTQWAAAGA